MPEGAGASSAALGDDGFGAVVQVLEAAPTGARAFHCQRRNIVMAVKIFVVGIGWGHSRPCFGHEGEFVSIRTHKSA
jgi:hypothetical protein